MLDYLKQIILFISLTKVEFFPFSIHFVHTKDAFFVFFQFKANFCIFIIGFQGYNPFGLIYKYVKNIMQILVVNYIFILRQIWPVCLTCFIC